MNEKEIAAFCNIARVALGLRPMSVEQRRAIAKLRRRRAAALARELDAINQAWIDSPNMPSEHRNERGREAVRRHEYAAADEEKALYDAFSLARR